MIASVAKEEALTVDEVREILDEASQIVVYSHRLEHKSRELEAATAELRAANERLKELDRLKDDFVSTVTHELRTPLTSIRAFSQILLEDPQIEAGERQKFVAIITHETETAHAAHQPGARPLEDRIGQGRVAGIEHRYARRDRRHRQGHEPGVRRKAHPGRSDVADKVSAVRADVDRVIQVLLNLLSNAVKFCNASQGRIEIAVAEDGGELRIDVRDNGAGINPSDHAIIFDKFSQAGNKLTEKPYGSGLGLYISRQIVEHWGGRLWVESTRRSRSLLLVHAANRNAQLEGAKA